MAHYNFIKSTYFYPFSWFLITKSWLTLCDPMDCSMPGSSVHGISQARILEWVAISFCRGSSWPKDGTQVSCIAGRLFTVWTTREILFLPLTKFLPSIASLIFIFRIFIIDNKGIYHFMNIFILSSYWKVTSETTLTAWKLSFLRLEY